MTKPDEIPVFAISSWLQDWLCRGGLSMLAPLVACKRLSGLSCGAITASIFLGFAAVPLYAQGANPNADLATRQAIVNAEVARAPQPEDLQTLIDGTHSDS